MGCRARRLHGCDGPTRRPAGRGCPALRPDDRERGRPALAIVHDPVLQDDPGLVSAAVAAVRLSIENERLQAEVRTQLEAVRASRARLVEAATRNDVGSSVISTTGRSSGSSPSRFRCSCCAVTLGPTPIRRPSPSSTPRRPRHGLRSPRSRELARGVHPAVLTEAGLDAPSRLSPNGRSFRSPRDLDRRSAPWRSRRRPTSWSPRR